MINVEEEFERPLACSSPYGPEGAPYGGIYVVLPSPERFSDGESGFDEVQPPQIDSGIEGLNWHSWNEDNQSSSDESTPSFSDNSDEPVSGSFHLSAIEEDLAELDEQWQAREESSVFSLPSFGSPRPRSPEWDSAYLEANGDQMAAPDIHQQVQPTLKRKRDSISDDSSLLLPVPGVAAKRRREESSREWSEFCEMSFPLQSSRPTSPDLVPIAGPSSHYQLGSFVVAGSPHPMDGPDTEYHPDSSSSTDEEPSQEELQTELLPRLNFLTSLEQPFMDRYWDLHYEVTTERYVLIEKRKIDLKDLKL